MLYHPGCGNGGGVLCFEVLRHLAQRAQVHFVGFSAGAADEAIALAALRAVAHSVTAVLLPPPPLLRGPASLLPQLLSGLPREVRGTRSEPMRTALAALAQRVKADAVLLQFPHMAQYAGAAPGVPVIVDVQDACTVSRWREWRSVGGSTLRRLMRLHSWWCWARYEVAAYAQAQRLMALSETDCGVLRAFVPRVPAFLSPVAWDVTPRRAQPAGENVLFMGNFAHAPNADGLRWVLAEVWPLVRARRAAARLQVAGLNLPADFSGNESTGVQSLGFVPDVGPLLAGAALSLVPYRFGGGIKIKTVEAMARGCAVVATTVGAEGLDAIDGVHLRVADSAAAFADAIVELLDSPTQRAALAEQAQALVAARFSWQAKMDGLMREIAAMLRERVPAARLAA